MSRPEDWPEKLAAFIERRLHAPFAWGTQDCCSFASDCVIEMTGIDPAAPQRGQYNSAFDGVRLLESLGGVEAAFDAAAEVNGWPVEPVLMAQRGDVLLFDSSNGPALGVCIGSEGAFPGEEGLTFIDVAKCRKAWRIQ